MSFLTGSQIYGTPTDKSDIDLVVMLTEYEYNLLIHEATGSYPGSSADGEESIVFGNLNIIPVFTPEQYELWHEARDFLLAEAPVTKDRAIEVHDQLRQGLKPVHPATSAIAQLSKTRRSL